jgi:hypothetical protein
MDFGQSSSFLNDDKIHVKRKLMPTIQCTVGYAGIGQLKGRTVCRKDDMEAIFYTMVNSQGLVLEELSDY